MQRIVKGQSMYPFLKALDICVCREILNSRIEFGDIVVYKNAGDNKLTVHRVLYVDKDGEYAIVKGDNIPYAFVEKVRISDIRDKVISIKRGERVFSLEVFPRRYIAKFLAFLSRYDLSPKLVKRRFIDPVLLGISRNPFYVFFRKLLYKNLYFMKIKRGNKYHIYAFVGKTESGRAILELTEDKGILISSYIRYRDRNSLFAERFIRRVIEIADKEYGVQYNIYITDRILKDLVRPASCSFCPDRIYFL